MTYPTPCVKQICTIRDDRTNIDFCVLGYLVWSHAWSIHWTTAKCIISTSSNEHLRKIHEKSTTSLGYTSLGVDDNAILYFENKNMRISSCFNKPNFWYLVLNLQTVRLTHISLNVGVLAVCLGYYFSKWWVIKNYNFHVYCYEDILSCEGHHLLS